jgi:ketosteroid isomerase-like protein
MSQENVKLVRALYEAWNRGAGPSALDLIDPEIEVNAEVGGLFDGTYRGYAGLGELLQSFWSNFEDYRTEVEQCMPAGDHVMVEVHHRARGKTSGAAVDMRQWQVWTFRDGRALRWRLMRSRQEALESAGLSE